MNISFVWGLLLGLLLGAAGMTLAAVYVANGVFYEPEDHPEDYFDNYYEEEQQ